MESHRSHGSSPRERTDLALSHSNDAVDRLEQFGDVREFGLELEKGTAALFVTLETNDAGLGRSLYAKHTVGQLRLGLAVRS